MASLFGGSVAWINTQCHFVSSVDRKWSSAAGDLMCSQYSLLHPDAVLPQQQWWREGPHHHWVWHHHRWGNYYATTHRTEPEERRFFCFFFLRLNKSENVFFYFEDTPVLTIVLRPNAASRNEKPGISVKIKTNCVKAQFCTRAACLCGCNWQQEEGESSSTRAMFFITLTMTLIILER